ncbi:MAG: type I secretion protein, partial [Pseudomonadota bacterium]
MAQEDQQFTGTDGADSFAGGSGNDSFTGGGDNDYATGGSGQDTLIGDTQTETTFDPSTITIVEDYTVTMTFDHEGAGYKNTIGMYTVDPETGVIEAVQVAWENASLAGSGGDLIGGQSSVQYDVSAGDELGFFLISD